MRSIWLYLSAGRLKANGIKFRNQHRRSLWSAVARYRFGNHPRFLRIVETGSPVSLSLVIIAKSKDDYQSGNKFPHSKASRSFSLNLMPLAFQSRVTIPQTIQSRQRRL